MLGSWLTLCTVLYWTGSFSLGKGHRKYEDYYFYTRYNGSKVTWMMMPDDNALVVSAVIHGLTPNQTIETDSIEFLCWSRKNPNAPETRLLKKNQPLKFRNYDPSRKTVVLIHGFTDNIKDADFFYTLVNALVENGDYNIIGVNWVKLAIIPWYAQGIKNSAFVGAVAARAIEGLRSLASGEPKEFRIISFNLGTLVAGVAGSLIKGKKIDRIIGLDPPYILTHQLPDSRKLDKTDADIVEIVHTSGDYIGINDPVGHRDFYPNGGKWPQAGCIYDIADRCSPRRSVQYYADSLIQRGGFEGLKCDNFMQFRQGKCPSETRVPLWNNVPASVTGKFYFYTNSEEPFWPLDPNF